MQSAPAQDVGALVLVGGPSYVGKTAVIDGLIRRGGCFVRPRSFTSRGRRPAEADGEYLFTTKEHIFRMHENGEVPTVDVVYGNCYAMDSRAIREILCDGKIAIKEVHPANHEKIRRSFPDVISLLMLPLDQAAQAGDGRVPTDRREEDFRYYSGIDTGAFDIVVYRSPGDSVDDVVAVTEFKISTLVSTMSLFPRPPEIHRTNVAGYAKVAEQFDDNRRITTRNFHDLTRSFFQEEIGRLTPGCVCAEVGPGRGWLRREFDWPSVEYYGIEVCQAMIGTLSEQCLIRADACAVPFPQRHFDVVMASLADPYCHPMALTEIWRILKPGGRFVCTAPSAVWASGTRPAAAQAKTEFMLDDGSKAEVYSFTYTADGLCDILKRCGFIIHCSMGLTGHGLGTGIRISPAITESAARLGVRVEDLPIVNAVVAGRGE